MPRLSRNQSIAIAAAILAVVFIVVVAWAFLFVASRQQPEASQSTPPREDGASHVVEPEPVSEDAVSLLICGLDDAAGLTDVIMLVRFDVENGRINVLQIPRDTYIGESYRTGKINQVYFSHRKDAEPIRGLIGVINTQLSVPVDHYVTLTLQAFRELVDALGGVTVEVPQRIEFLPDKIIEQGKQHLNGERAEWFVRYRAGYPTGDIGRVNAQKLMIDALAQAVRDKGRAGMLLLATQNYDKISTDLPLSQALSLANEAFKVEKEKIQVFTLEGTGKMQGGFAVYEADRQKLTELLNLHFRPEGQPVQSINIAQVPLSPQPPQPPLPQPQEEKPQPQEEEPPPPPQQPEAAPQPPAEEAPSSVAPSGDIAGAFPID